MPEIKIEGVEPLLQKLEAFNRQFAELHKQVPQQLVEWQTEDMRRKYPNVKVDETPQSTEATTTIWPRSRLELQPGFKRSRPTTKQGPTVARIKNVGRHPASTRPLLRTELFRKLVDRMTRLLDEATKWP
jgi:hypothetical protein